MRQSIPELIVTFFPIGLITIAVGGIGLSLLMQRPDYIVRSLFIIVPCVVLAYLILRKKINADTEVSIPTLQISNKIPIIIYIIAGISIIWGCYLTSHRTIFILIPILAMVSAIILQILNKKLNAIIILSEIIGLGIIVAYSITLNYPLYFGGTDLLILEDFLTVFIESNQLLMVDYDDSYASFPLYFVYYSIVNFLTELPIFLIFHSIAPLIFIAASVLLIYCIIKPLVHDNRIILLCTLTYIGFSDAVYYATYVVPRVMAFIGFLLMVAICVLRYSKEKKDKIPYLSLYIIVSLYEILVHQVSVFQILAVVITGIIICTILFKKIYCWQELVIFIGMIIIYWIYTSLDFLSTLIFQRGNFISSFGISHVSSGMGAVDTTYSYLIENLDKGLILFLSLLAIYFILKKNMTIPSKMRKVWISFACLAVPMLLFMIPNPLTMSYIFSTLMRADRMELLLTPLYALLVVIGITYLASCIIRKREDIDKKIATTIIITIIIMCIFTIFGFSIGTSPDMDQTTHRNYFIQSELSSFSFIEENTLKRSEIALDYESRRYFSARVEEGYSIINRSYFKTSPTEIFEDRKDEEYTLIRYKEFENSGLYIDDNQGLRTIYDTTTPENEIYLSKGIFQTDEIYDDYSVKILYNKM